MSGGGGGHGEVCCTRICEGRAKSTGACKILLEPPYPILLHDYAWRQASIASELSVEGTIQHNIGPSLVPETRACKASCDHSRQWISCRQDRGPKRPSRS